MTISNTLSTFPQAAGASALRFMLKAPGSGVGGGPKPGFETSARAFDPSTLHFSRRTVLGDATLREMEGFSKKVREKHGAGADANPVFFGLNHDKWWLGLVQRDALFLGPLAIATGGRILYARFQEDPRAQEEIEVLLEEITAAVAVEIVPPSLESWWRPVWEKFAASDSTDLDGVTSLLQQVVKEDPDLAEQWLMEVASKDFDRSEAIREKAFGAKIALPDPALGWDDIDALTRPIKDPSQWAVLNEGLEDRYLTALQNDDERIIIATLAQLRRVCVLIANHYGVNEPSEPSPVPPAPPPKSTAGSVKGRLLEFAASVPALRLKDGRVNENRLIRSIVESILAAVIYKAFGNVLKGQEVEAEVKTFVNLLQREGLLEAGIAEKLLGFFNMPGSTSLHILEEALGFPAQRYDSQEGALFYLVDLLTGRATPPPMEQTPTQGPSSTAVPRSSARFGGVISPFNFDSLPKVPVEEIPEEYRHLIPTTHQGKVLFPRFRRILDEQSSLVMSPDRIMVRNIGPPGTGKTTLPEMIAGRMGVPLLRFPVSKRTDPSDFDGSWRLVNGDGKPPRPIFEEGVASLAMEKGFHLVLDEPDLGRPGVLAYLNNVIAPGKTMRVRRKDGSLEEVPVHPRYRCWVTENGLRELSRQEHGKDFLRRFVPYYVGPWTKEEVTEILTTTHPELSARMAEVLSLFHLRMTQLAEGIPDPETGESLPPLGSGIGQSVAFTPRSVLRLAERFVKSGACSPWSLSRAIRAEYILPLADPQDREIVWAQASAIFSFVLGGVGSAVDVITPGAITTPTFEQLCERYKLTRDDQSGFVWTDQALRIADEILWNRSLGIDVMLLGEAGEGKTEIPRELARLLKKPYFGKVLSSETDEEDLIGGPGQDEKGRTTLVKNEVALAAEAGGILHLDEYFLADTAKIEAVMNPLMDDAHALFLKNPFQKISRNPDLTIIGSSNPSWGDYEDRTEQSGAAMSRFAVICLVDELSMTPEDRFQILKGIAGRLTLLGLKKKTEIGGVLRDAIRPVRFTEAMQDPQGPEDRFVSPKIHPELRRKFNLPENLIVDREKRELMERDTDGLLVPLRPQSERTIGQFTGYFTRRTKVEMAPVTDHVFKILFGMYGRHATDLNSKDIFIDIVDILNYPLAGGLGIGKHEWAHATIDRPSTKYDATEPGRLLANAIGDPRMNEYASSLRPDFREQVMTAIDQDWPEEWDAERIALFKTALPHEQFAHALIYGWRHGKLMPWIEDPRVGWVVGAAFPKAKEAFTLFPKSTEDADVDQAAGEFYRVVDEVWPIYEKLIEESRKEIEKRLGQGQLPEALKNPMPNPMDGMKPERSPMEGPSGEEMKKLVSAILDARAEKLADQLEPKDPNLFAKRKEEIAKAKALAQSGSPSPQPSPARGEGAPLTPEELARIQAEQKKALAEATEGDLFRRMIPPSALKAARRLKRVLPPENPAFMEGYFKTGKRISRKKLVQNATNPVPDGKVMLRRLGIEGTDASLVLVSDVSGSIKNAGGVDNALRTSATGIFLAETLKMSYGEILFGSGVRVAKPLGGPLQTYRRKNDLLKQKKSAFEDDAINGGTNLRQPLALAIEELKKKGGHSKWIVLVTDGRENVRNHSQTLPELEAAAEEAGIHLVVIAIGDAKDYVPQIFKNHRLAADDGADIPDLLVDLFSTAHGRRFRK